MEKKTFTITSEFGLHARAASTLVKRAARFQSEMKLSYQDKNVNLKSTLGVMALAIPNHAEITITADGEDEKEAIAAMEELIGELKLAE